MIGFGHAMLVGALLLGSPCPRLSACETAPAGMLRAPRVVLTSVQDRPVAELVLDSWSYDRASRRFQIQLLNKSSRTAVAWRYAILVDGVPVMLVTRDYYLGTAFADVRTTPPSVIRSGMRRQDSVPFVAPDTASATIQLVATVFDDRSAEGEAEAVNEIFARREADRRELTTLVATLRSARGSPRQQMETVLAELRHASVEDSSPRLSLREDLERVLTRSAPDRLDSELERLIVVYERMLDAASRHSR